MSDKLDWRNRHAVLFQHRTVQGAVREGKYKLTGDLAPLAAADPTPSEDFAAALEAAGRHKELCEFLAYAMHRRAAVWWGYRCVVALQEELEANPAVERDIADIGAPKPFEVPAWAQAPDTSAADAADQAKRLALADKLEADAKKIVADVRAVLPPEAVEIWDACWSGVNAEFKSTYGVTIEELAKRAAEKDAGPDFTIDENSPIFQEVAKLKAQLETVRQETVAQIKSVLPPVDLKLKRRQRDGALDAVFRWVAAPDEMNTKKAFDAGNECPDQPAGLLALAAAWSFGDLAPTEKTMVPTPPGLAANGLNATLLQCALAKGGTRKTAERFRLYAALGLETVRGRSNWADAVIEMMPPHLAFCAKPRPARFGR